MANHWEHITEILPHTREEIVVDGKTEIRNIYQTICSCGYRSPRRTNLWEVEDDARNHKKHPMEGQ